MAKIDLGTLTRKELLKLRKDVDRAIRNFEKRRLDEARAAVEAKARELGYSLSQLANRSSEKMRNPPKYKHPEDSALTWSGRGRQPAWVRAHLEAGKPLDELTI
ncbi:MAG: H-NS histone family protein [Rhodobacteraceae bacterium]|nr:H-NS histone family protein [Paracoccaceae bacterium]